MEADTGIRVTPDSLSRRVEAASPLLIPLGLGLRDDDFEESFPRRPNTRLKPEGLNVKLDFVDLVEFAPSFASVLFVSEGDTGE